MNDVENRRYQMLIRVRDFGASHAVDFPATTLGGQMFAEVTAVVAELERHATDQSVGASGARTGSASKALARAAVREDLQAINLTARAIALDTPGLENKFRLPRSASDQALLTAARAFAEDAAPLSAGFIKHEMPADFLTDLKKDIDAFDAAVTERNLATETRVKATASVDSAMEGGITAMQRLEAIVRNKYRNDAPSLSAWESASHVERNVRSNDKTKTGAPKPDASTPQSPAGSTPA